MVHGYDTEKRLIKAYHTVEKFKIDDKIYENQLVIEYLDGSIRNMPYTEERESMLLNRMLAQAIERSQCADLIIKARKEELSSLLCMLVSISGILVNLLNSKYIYQSNEYHQTLNVTLFALLIRFLYIYVDSKEEVEELKKYDIYLSIKNDLDNLPKNLQERIGCAELTINLLDMYSLKEIKKIENKLTKIIIDSEMFKMTAENKTLSLDNRK